MLTLLWCLFDWFLIYNYQRKPPIHIDDGSIEGLQDGTKFLALLEVLSGERLVCHWLILGSSLGIVDRRILRLLHRILREFGMLLTYFRELMGIICRSENYPASTQNSLSVWYVIDLFQGVHWHCRSDKNSPASTQNSLAKFFFFPKGPFHKNLPVA